MGISINLGALLLRGAGGLALTALSALLLAQGAGGPE